jgi:Na+-driven multidrug efflux pump
LQGAGATRLPLRSRATGIGGFFVGFSYLAVTDTGLGVTGVYAGVVLAHVWMGVTTVAAFRDADWTGTAAGLLRERGSRPGEG